MSTPPPPPPPSDDQYPSFTPGPENGNGGLEMESLDRGAPGVASNPGRVFVVLGIVGVVLMILLYQVFFAGRDKKDANGLEHSIAAGTVAPAPPAPPTPVFQPPPVPKPTEVPMLKPQDDSAALAALRARLHSNMIIGGEGSGLADLFGGDNDIASNDPNLQFLAATNKANTKAARVKATYIGNLNRTIAQGRLIQATLESAIDTDLPAPIRAIVARDTYAEAGTEPLIPKGSRLIGQYSTDLMGGQSRVFIVWTRVIRPDGIDVMLGSPAVDQIGMAGMAGQVDNKFQQIFSRAILGSIISIGFAVGVDKVDPSAGQTSTTTSTFGTTQSGSAASTATVDSLNRLGAVTESFLSRYVNAKPTILIDQGSPINVFVNRDLVFPADMAGGRVIP